MGMFKKLQAALVDMSDEDYARVLKALRAPITGDEAPYQPSENELLAALARELLDATAFDEEALLIGTGGEHAENSPCCGADDGRNSASIKPDRYPSSDRFALNVAQVGDALDLLRSLPDACTPLVWFDPQHRAVLDQFRFGNEGARQRCHAQLPAMTEYCIDAV